MNESGETASGKGAEPTGQSETSLVHSAWWWIRAAAMLATVWLAYQLLLIAHAWLLAILSVVLYVAFGAVLALVAGPAVSALTHRRVPRPVAIALVVGGGLLVMGVVIYWVGLNLVQEVTQLSHRLPTWMRELQQAYRDDIQPLAASLGINLNLQSLPTGGDLAGRLPALVIGGVTSALTLTVDVLIVLVSCIWLLASASDLRRGVLAYLPGRAHAAVAFGLDTIVVVFGGYVRAQLLIALMIGAMAGIGCALIGVPFPILIAVFAGLFELVPIVGPFAGGAVALLLAATSGWTLVLWTLLLFVAIHAAEGYVLAPRVQARFVRIHPYLAFLALFAGIEVGGFVGALFAVPVASMLAVFVKSAVDEYQLRHGGVSWQPDEELLARRRKQLEQFTFFDSEHPLRRLTRRWTRRSGRRPGQPDHG